MMRRRLLWLTFGVVASVAIAFGWVADFQWPRSTQVNAKRFESTRLGMTREQVIAIVGGPPGDYRTDKRISPLRGFWRGEPQKYDYWLCNDGEVYLLLDADDRLSGIGYGPMVDMRPNRLRWFTRQLGYY